MPATATKGTMSATKDTARHSGNQNAALCPRTRCHERDTHALKIVSKNRLRRVSVTKPLATKGTKALAPKNTKGVSLALLRDLRAFRDLHVRRGFVVLLVCFVAPVAAATGAVAAAAQETPELTQPINDFANVIDHGSERAMESLIRSLHEATGDAVVVATVDTFKPFADIDEMAVKMFENHGRGIGAKGKDNGVLILLAVEDREVRIEVGYDLEEFVTDGFAGETSREYMAPEFRQGQYGPGLVAGVSRVIGRISDARNVTLQGVPRVTTRRGQPQTGSGLMLLVGLFVMFIVVRTLASAMRGGTRRRYRRQWGGGPWSGWHSGVGPFGGGGFSSGGFGGGGFGGGFGGFGGGRSGGGGGGASW
jgi:uncharacterized protein